MLTGGLILQFASAAETHRRLLLGAAALASLLAFLVWDLPGLLENQEANQERSSYVAESRKDLLPLQHLVPPPSVVAINGLTSIEWTDESRRTNSRMNTARLQVPETQRRSQMQSMHYRLAA